jgi:hypothetical protein
VKKRKTAPAAPEVVTNGKAAPPVPADEEEEEEEEEDFDGEEDGEEDAEEEEEDVEEDDDADDADDFKAKVKVASAPAVTDAPAVAAGGDDEA